MTPFLRFFYKKAVCNAYEKNEINISYSISKNIFFLEKENM